MVLRSFPICRYSGKNEPTRSHFLCPCTRAKLRIDKKWIVVLLGFCWCLWHRVHRIGTHFHNILRVHIYRQASASKSLWFPFQFRQQRRRSNAASIWRVRMACMHARLIFHLILSTRSIFSLVDKSELKNIFSSIQILASLWSILLYHLSKFGLRTNGIWKKHQS